MRRDVLRVVGVAAAGALVPVLLLAVLYAGRPVISVEMDRDLPDFTSGFHPPERAGDLTFAWSYGRAVLRLSAVDRRVDWTCSVRFRGARGEAGPQPVLTLSADGAARVERLGTNDFQDLELGVPARRDRSGLTLMLTALPTFVPGPGDARELGVQVDRIGCRPVGHWLLPPMPAVRSVALGGAALAAALGLVGVTTVPALAIAAVWGLLHALLLSTNGGAVGDYPARVEAVGLTAAAVLLLLTSALARLRRAPLSTTALAAIVVSIVAASVELLALLHPAKPVIDAVFQAHRLDWVLGGRYFFTQPLPDGVQFPYAIGLYLTAMPFAGLTADHVSLLRIVVVVANAAAGLALYPLVVRWWNDGRAGLAAVTLFHVVPLPFVVIGNANLPNTFAQSVALATLALSVRLFAGAPRAAVAIAVTLLTALAFLSHVSTLVLLAGLMGAIGVTQFVLGGREGRRGAVVFAAAGAIALVLATTLYYRHFPEVYARVARVWTTTATAPEVTGPAREDAPSRPAALVRPLALHEKVRNTLTQTTGDLGWPLVILAVGGGVLLAMARSRDPLSIVLMGWLAGWVICLAAGTVTRVDTAYQRYAAEFIGRVNLAGYPVAVLLAARALSWAWRADRPGVVRWGAAALFGAALALGVSAWRGWVL